MDVDKYYQQVRNDDHCITLYFCHFNLFNVYYLIFNVDILYTPKIKSNFRKRCLKSLVNQDVHKNVAVFYILNCHYT